MDTDTSNGTHCHKYPEICNSGNNLSVENPTFKHPAKENNMSGPLILSVKLEDTSQEITPDNDDRKSGMESDHWDKGWAWFVVIAASICNLIIFGSLKSAGIILNEVTMRYQASPIAASILIVINVSCTILWSK